MKEMMKKSVQRFEYDEFLIQIKELIEIKVEKENLYGECGEEHRTQEVQIHTVVKNNGVTFDGLTIFTKDKSSSPNIYLNDFYVEYRKGRSISDIVEQIWDIYICADMKGIDDEEDVYDFDAIKDKVVFRIVNHDMNQELLKKIPHVCFLDLAIIFHCLIKNSQEGIASLRITNEIAESWGMNGEKLLPFAISNSQRIFPGVIKTMKEVIRDMMLKRPFMPTEEDMPYYCSEGESAYFFSGEKEEEETDEYIEKVLEQISQKNKHEMFILSNINGINGASALLYQGLVRQFAGKMESDIYILPSSVHEIILLPNTGDISCSELKKMVKEINGTQVPEEEILSDNVYMYRLKEDMIGIVHD